MDLSSALLSSPSSSSRILSSPNFVNEGKSTIKGGLVPRRQIIRLCSSPTPTRRHDTPATLRTFGFGSLKDTFSIDVSRAEGRPLDVPLAAPFTIASSRLDAVSNVAVRVELRNGSVGWGEAPVLPSVTAEDQPTALAAASDACAQLVRSPPVTLGAALDAVGRFLPGHQFASVRAGVEMALIDAAANSIRVPLWRLFGGASDSITTDITIPIVTPSEAAELALKYRKQGFSTLKLKVGKDLNSDIEVLRAIRSVFPDCSFVLDANEGYNVNQAIDVLDRLYEMGVTPILFEQPVHRDDWEGLGYVSDIAKSKYNVSVAADESCRGIDDAKKIIQGNLAHVINIKLAKLGVLGALHIIDIAREAGIALMIGGMVETRLAMGFAGHLAAGLGCFSFIDLDTPLLLAEDPVIGGYEVHGAVYKFNNSRGQGGFLHWDNISWERCYWVNTNWVRKDGAFALPILHALLDEPHPFFACVLSPTRELAIQIGEQFEALGSSIGVKCTVLVGGVDMVQQAISLGKRLHNVVGTPGRLFDHLSNTKGFNLRTIKYLVLDEADKLLYTEFEKAIDDILNIIPADRKTYLFSATMTKKVDIVFIWASFRGPVLKNPVKIESASKYSTVETLEQQSRLIPAKHKECYLVYILTEMPDSMCMVFTRTCESTRLLAELLRNLRLKAIPISGQMGQAKQLGALNKFKAGDFNILICTDVASRGLDIPSVDMVINYDIPTNSKDYIHRVGRTARAGRTGLAISLVNQYEVEWYLQIEKLIGKKLPEYPAEEALVLMHLENVLDAKRISHMKLKEINGNKRRRKSEGEDDDDELDKFALTSKNGKAMKKSKRK